MFALTSILPSCQKEVQQKQVVKEIKIDTTISAGTDYRLELAEYGEDGDFASIVDKGTNASISELENESDVFTTIYHYKPRATFTGTDLVTLSIHQHECDGDSTVIYLNVTVK